MVLESLTVAFTAQRSDSLQCDQLSSAGPKRRCQSCVTTTRASSPSWIWQNPLPQGNPLSSVSCSNSHTCIAVGILGAIIATSDGGASWHSQISGTSNDLLDVSCASSSVCVAVGKAGTILVTENGGDSWQRPVSGTPGDLSGVSCPSISHCVVVGTGFSTSNDGIILTTNNGGGSWISQVGGAKNPLSSVSCPTTIACLAVGEEGGLITNDGGISWTTLSVPTGYDQLTGVSCPTSSICMVVGTPGPYGRVGPVVLTTANGGADWTTRATGVNYNPSGVSCPEHQHLLCRRRPGHHSGYWRWRYHLGQPGHGCYLWPQ